MYVALDFALFPQCEAMVNTTDQNLGFGGNVSQALLKAAGDSLKDECEKKKPVAVGGVAVTGAGNLKCKRIIHTVLPSYDGPHGTAEKVRKCSFFIEIIIIHTCGNISTVNFIKWCMYSMT